MSLIYNFIATCLYYQEADAICAVPARPEKGYDLPTEIAKGLSEQLSKVDLTAHLEWAQQKVKLKELPLDERWKALERAQLNISTNVDKMDIILLDDLYQSGVTMHYVGRQLFEAGANSVYGISIVKSWRDTDNM